MPELSSALVTGATGFLGGHLCGQLLERGVAVRAGVRRERPSTAALARAGAELVPAPLDDLQALARAAHGVEVVFHVAALASYVAPWPRIEAANVTGTRNVLAAARRAGARRLVFVSSESVTLRNADRVEEDEDAPYPRRFLDNYSRSKALAEQEVLAAGGAGLETVAVRPPWIWGEGDTSVLKAIALAILGNSFLWLGDGSNRITTCHAANVARGLVLAALSPRAPGRVYHLADAVRPTLRDFIGGLCEAASLPLPRRRVPYSLAYALAAACDLLRSLGVKAPLMISRPYLIHLGRTWTFRDRRARQELGYEPVVSLEEGFGRLAAWIEQSGGLRPALGR
ncbi:MAG: NAD-dependent epimerase/dehydratase family protein [Desulfarculus sp.]|nr:MAG: NAD-dependent epimerase/dehydratase family protein [Desulfarculus sp.]